MTKSKHPYRGGNKVKLADCPLCLNRVAVRGGRYGSHAKPGQSFCPQSGQVITQVRDA